jgi:hypothetical protein
LSSQQQVQNARPQAAPEHAAQIQSPLIDVPAAFSPVVAVIVGGHAPARPSPPPSGDRPWRVVHLKPTGRCGADTKRAFHEGLRAGGRSVVIWPGELGPWQTGMHGLLRPILTRHADVVLTGYSPDAAEAGLQSLPGRYLWPLFGSRRSFAVRGPLAITRRALEVVPFEADADDQLFGLQLLSQAQHFGLEVAPCLLSPADYLTLRDLPHSAPPSGLAQIRCGLELRAHRWGLVDSPRFQAPQMTHVSRWMISKDRT